MTDFYGFNTSRQASLQSAAIEKCLKPACAVQNRLSRYSNLRSARSYIDFTYSCPANRSYRTLQQKEESSDGNGPSFLGLGPGRVFNLRVGLGSGWPDFRLRANLFGNIAIFIKKK